MTTTDRTEWMNNAAPRHEASERREWIVGLLAELAALREHRRAVTDQNASLFVQVQKLQAELADRDKASDPPLSAGLRKRCIEDLSDWLESFEDDVDEGAVYLSRQLIADLRAAAEQDDERCSFVGHAPNPKYVRSDAEIAAPGIKPLRAAEPQGITRELFERL